MKVLNIKKKLTRSSIIHPLARGILKYLHFFKAFFSRKQVIKNSIINYHSDESQLVINGTIYSNFNILQTSLSISKFRQEQIDFTSKIDLVRIPSFKQFILFLIFPFMHIRGYIFSTTTDIPWHSTPVSIYSVFLNIGNQKMHFSMHENCNKILYLNEQKECAYLYFDPSVKVVRLEYFKLGRSEIEKLIEYGKTKKNASSERLVTCIISEYTNSARDNGIALFNSLKSLPQGIDPYYVIERENLDNYKIAQSGVLEFGSYEHLKTCLDSQVVAFTHHRTSVYPHILRVISEMGFNKVKTLFLQHGVTALKKSVERLYNKKRVNYDALCVCSKQEKEIFTAHFKYDASQIFITGFPRHDILYAQNKAHAGKEHILIFPTWRKDLEKIDSDNARSTSFVKEWISALDALRKEFSIPIIFMLHPVLQKHMELFQQHADAVKIATDFQADLLKSACLITDYSSVIFEALYIDKPIVLFHFDVKEYGLRSDAYVDIDTNLPGLVSLNVTELVNNVKILESNGWVQSSSSLQKNYFARVDAKNSERVANVIKALALL